jgi:hypothetical protein
MILEKSANKENYQIDMLKLKHTGVKWKYFSHLWVLFTVILMTNDGDLPMNIEKRKIKEKGKLPAHLVPTCNPSYSGGRNQEDHSSKPAPGNSL